MIQPSTIIPALRNFAVTSAVDIARSCSTVVTPASSRRLPGSSARARVGIAADEPSPIHEPL